MPMKAVMLLAQLMLASGWYTPSAAHVRRLPCGRAPPASLSAPPPREDSFDMNAAITALNAAVANEDYAEAARLKAMIAEATPAASPSTWRGACEALPEWLLDRLEALGYRYPTPIQAASLRCTRDALLRAPTGSGKTLAYLLPLCVAAASELDTRAAATCEAVEAADLSPTDALGALAPALTSGVPTADPFAAIGGEGGGALLSGVPLRGPPLALVVVPTDALAEQVGALAFSLLGGYQRASRTWQPGASDSLFRYRGPKGCRVSLLRADSDQAKLRRASDDCDFLVATPAALAALRAADGVWRERADTRRVLDAVAGVAIDEADESLGGGGGAELASYLQDALPRDSRRLLAGATVALSSAADGSRGSRGGLRGGEWFGELLRSPQVCDGDGTVGGVGGGGGGAGAAGAAAGDGGAQEAPSVSRSVGHRAIVADSDGTRLTALARLMRSDLLEWQRQQQQQQQQQQPQQQQQQQVEEEGERAAAAAGDEPSAEGSAGGRPRAVVFAAGERAASAVGEALRTALWGAHAVAVLLPTQGEMPSLVADNFRRAVGAADGFAAMAQSQGASVLVAPASAARGLDFANVTHVYAIGLPSPSAAEYAHMAGRTGRIGQGGRGLMTSIVASDRDLAAVRAVVEGSLGQRLLVSATAAPEGSGGAAESADDAVRRLGDALLLDWQPPEVEE